MKHLCAVCCLVLIFMVPASGQTAQAPPAKRPGRDASREASSPPYVSPYELSGGYSSECSSRVARPE